MITWPILLITLGASFCILTYHAVVLGRLFKQANETGIWFTGLPNDFEECKVSFGKIFDELIPKLRNCSKHGAITMSLILVTLLAKLLETNVLPIPFWALVGFTIGLIVQLFALRGMIRRINMIVRTANAKIFEQKLREQARHSENQILKLTNIAKRGINSDLLKGQTDDRLQ